MKRLSTLTERVQVDGKPISVTIAGISGYRAADLGNAAALFDVIHRLITLTERLTFNAT